MALIVISDNLNIKNEDQTYRVYDTATLNYATILSVDFYKASISRDKKSVIVSPSTGDVGSRNILTRTSSGNISVSVYYEHEYDKQDALIGSSFDYYPRGMFVNSPDNPKMAEISAADKVATLSFPLSELNPANKKELIPLTKSVVTGFSQYCSSQVLGIAIQLAYAEWAVGNTSSTIVVYTDMNPLISTINDLLIETPGKLTATNSSIFVSAGTTARPTGQALPLPQHIGMRVINTVPPVPPVQPDPVQEYGINMVLYPNRYSPRKYNMITSPTNDPLELKYGAVKTEWNKLKYTGRNKVVYVGQNRLTDDDYFAFKVTPPQNGKGFRNVSTNPDPGTNAGSWWDGNSVEKELTTWRDIQGMPASNEVIYNKANIDISDLTQEFIIPGFNRFANQEEDMIVWLNSINSNLQKLAIKFDGKDFVCKAQSKSLLFTFDTPGQGFEDGVWR